MMTETMILGAVYAAVLICLVLYVRNRLDRLARHLDALSDKQSRDWREHKNDYHEVMRNHRKLVDALDMVEVPTQPSRYAKEEQP